MKLIIQGIPKNFQNIDEKNKNIKVKKLDLSKCKEKEIFK